MKNRIGFGKRFLAIFIDIIAITLLNIVLILIVGAFLANETKEQGQETSIIITLLGANLVSYVFNIVIFFLWFIWESLTGTSAGKLILGLQVKNADGSTANIKKLFTRAALKYSAFLFSIVGVIIQTIIPAMLKLSGEQAVPYTMTGGFLILISFVLGVLFLLGGFMVFGENKQALYDKISKTAIFAKD